MHDPDFRLALQRYARVRRLAYDTAQRVVWDGGSGAPVRFSDIDGRALEAWRNTWWRGHALGYGGWDWSGLVAPVWRRPTCFHLAIWSGDCLCGLAVGRASKRRRSGVRHTLSVHFLEGNPDPRHPLRRRVAPLALTAAEVYAALIGARRLRLISPLPGVMRTYERLGFSVAHDNDEQLYFEKRVDIDETPRF